MIYIINTINTRICFICLLRIRSNWRRPNWDVDFNASPW